MTPGLSNFVTDPLPPRIATVSHLFCFVSWEHGLDPVRKFTFFSTFCRVQIVGYVSTSSPPPAPRHFPTNCASSEGVFLNKGSQPIRTYILSLLVEKSHLSINCLVSQIRRSVIRCVPQKFSQLPFFVSLAPGYLFSLFVYI